MKRGTLSCPLIPEFTQDIDDHSLYRDIGRRSRFITNQEIRLAAMLGRCAIDREAPSH